MDAVSYSHSAKQAKRIEKIINEPDSTSGVVTVPSVIAAGESVTVPAGRTAVLPNVQVDGTLTVDGDVFVPSGATYADLENQIATKQNTLVNQTNIKSINSTSLLGSGNLDTTTTQIGVGQTWQDVTASRSAGVTYTNTTGKPIDVVISGANQSGFFWYVDGIALVGGSGVTFSNRIPLSFTVPDGSTYSVGGSGLEKWLELR